MYSTEAHWIEEDIRLNNVIGNNNNKSPIFHLSFTRINEQKKLR